MTAGCWLSNAAPRSRANAGSVRATWSTARSMDAAPGNATGTWCACRPAALPPERLALRFRTRSARALPRRRRSCAHGAARPDARMPRILLIVDEFQEFFVEDDRYSQMAALLLDRLVRQGRAFGIHVLLGSQTLGGAYSLARTTIGQMAVRIALQCNEADAHLILSDDNPAARLLSRPGEAIYNAANGLVQGNDFFQVVWINDDRREQYLTRIQQLADDRHFVPPAPQIVFEGNAPA